MIETIEDGVRVLDFTPTDEDYEEAEAYLRDLRRLVESAGNPFIKVTFEPADPETGEGNARFDIVGIETAHVPGILRELADLLEAQHG